MKEMPLMFKFDATYSSAVRGEPAALIHRADDHEGPLSPALLERMNRYWMAANYLTVGQIYLHDNPLLREPLRPEQIKPRLLGHWGTSPGLSLIYVHLNRLIREQGCEAIYLAGPGHGGPALIANTYLEGTYSEIYPAVAENEEGMRRLFRQFSTPGGVPSHVSVPTPGSIHEGGELGYVLTHAYGAAFDNPELLVAAVVGDGEAETGPLAGSWKSTSFLNPARDGAVLPILHLNGYKIANPTIFGRMSDPEIHAFLAGSGFHALFVEGDDPPVVHQRLAAVLNDAYARIRELQELARSRGVTGRPVWPAIVLRTPKGWTGPEVVDDLPVEGTFRSHQVPLSGVKTNPEHLAQLEAWLRSYRPEEQFDDEGRLRPELAELAPVGDLRMGANPHVNGGRLTIDLPLPDFRAYAVDVPAPAGVEAENTRPLGKLLRDLFQRTDSTANFRLFCPDELASNRLDDVLQTENRCFVGPLLDVDSKLSPDGRVMEVLSEHLCEGWLEGYTLTGRHGLYVTYEAFAMVSASMTVQHTKWLQEARALSWRRPVPSLNVLLTSTCWRNDHNGFSHQGPGLIDVMLSKRGSVARVYLPPDANCLLSIADHCLRSRDYVNLIVIDKQPHLQYLSIEDAAGHCARGASVWRWAGTDGGGEPDVVLAAAGDVPTMETLAAAEWLRHRLPSLKTRVVNIVDLMTLFPADDHPHGMSAGRFVELFTEAKPVIFAFHGYQRAIHQLVHGRANAERFHVRGFSEQGTTTTPFDMLVLNRMSRYHLAKEALRRAGVRRPDLHEELDRSIAEAVAYSREHMEDRPEITKWRWAG
jgi:xylulose-5-phosphate/fructose-6-phosphate phosphoketolase